MPNRRSGWRCMMLPRDVADQAASPTSDGPTRIVSLCLGHRQDSQMTQGSGMRPQTTCCTANTSKQATVEGRTARWCTARCAVQTAVSSTLEESNCRQVMDLEPRILPTCYTPRPSQQRSAHHVASCPLAKRSTHPEARSRPAL